MRSDGAVAAGRTPPTDAQPGLGRRFEAIVFDWDGTAVPDRAADATRLREAVLEACAAGLDLAVVTGTNIENVDGQLRARPTGPGELVMAVNRGSEAFLVGADGPQLLERRSASADEDAALTKAAQLTVSRLASRGLQARVVAARLNRRKIDVIPEPSWADPPKARIAELLDAVQGRLRAAGISGLAEAVDIATTAARDAGLADPRVTSDAKHVEIGLTDKSDAARWVMRWLWRRGIAPSQVLLAGDEWGSLGGLAGSDSYLRAGRARAAAAVSVGVEPSGVPEGVLALGGGPERFLAVLAEQVALRGDGEPPRADSDRRWTVEVADGDRLLARVQESLLSIADGRMGTRGSLLTREPGEDPGVFLAGVYTGSGAESHLLGAPWWSVLSLPDGAGLPRRRVLDLHAGTLSHELGGGGGAARIRALALCSAARPGTAVLRVRASGVDAPSGRGLLAPGEGRCEEGEEDGSHWLEVAGSPGSIAAAGHDRLMATAPGDGARAWALERVACYEGDADVRAARDRALGSLREGQALGFERLLSAHRRVWAERWQDADVRIEGDDELQRAVRFAIFHVLANAGGEDEAAVGARGLTGRAYGGHVFWDSEVYVLPLLAATRPRAARAMLEYRLRRLPAALRAARDRGRGGARFPWESAASGEDVTPATGRDGEGREVSILTGPLEEHVVADVAWAACCYADWTGDEEFANGPGRELLVQTARWWASRIELDEHGAGHISDVIGPDEYHEHVDDNAYTNVMARQNLRRAAAAAAGALDERERRHWELLADALVDGYRPACGLYEQFAGFFDLEPLVIAELAPQRPVAADLLLGHRRVREAQVVKQADALMLHYLVPEQTAAGSLAPNLDYYEPRTAHGSTLSPGVHAALLARAGRAQQALELLRMTSRIDLDDIGQMTAGGLHMAAMGSVWRTLSFGFAGLWPAGDALAVDPVALPGIESLEVRVRFRGSRVRVRIGPHDADIRAQPAIVARLPDGRRQEVGPGGRRFALVARPAAVPAAVGRPGA